jgi:hypothetical protein
MKRGNLLSAVFLCHTEGVVCESRADWRGAGFFEHGIVLRI